MTKKTKRPKNCVIVDAEADAPCQLARVGSRGPGYLPGKAALHKGKLYATPDFPMADAERILKLHGLLK